MTDLIYGAKYHAYKRAHSQTAYRYYGDDGIPYQDEDGNLMSGDTGDDLLTVKILDHYGRTVGSYTSNSDESKILGTGAATYTENSGTSKKNNRITSTASAGQQGINLLKNSSAENGTSDWTNSATNTTAHYIGDQSFTATTSTFYQTVSLTGGEYYTFSAYVNVPDDTTFSDTGSIRLAFLNSSGSEQISSEAVNYGTSSINEGWIRLTVTYASTSTASYRVAVIPTGVTGSIYVDALQLEAGEAASTYNILENSSFEFYNAVSSSNYGWTSAASPTLASDDVVFGAQYASLTGTAGTVCLNQSVKLNLSGDSSFIFSGWAKANAKPDSADDTSDASKPYFGLLLRLYYDDDTSELYCFPFDPYYTDWQYIQGIVAPKRDDSVTITKAYAVACYDNNINGVCFDNFSLRVEPVQTYSYNEDGLPVATTQTGVGEESYTYEGANLKSYVAPNLTQYTYTYNDQNDVTTAVVNGLTSTYGYDDSGNMTSSVLTNSADSKELKTSMTPTTDDNYTRKITDVNGNLIENIPNAYSGQTIRTITHPDEDTSVTIRYRYTNSLHRLQSVELEQTDSTLWPEIYIYYDYEDGALAALQRRSTTDGSNAKWQKYAFEKNDWGQETAITVSGGTAQNTYTDSIILAEYEYEANNGNLTKMYYGDDADSDTNYAEYTYDLFDRLTRIEYNSGRYITYAYNAEGALAKMTYGDGTTEKGSYLFEYDSLGRQIRSVEYDGDGNLVQRTEQLYDEYSRLESQNWVIGTSTYSESYTYDDPTEAGASGDGSLSSVTTATGDTLEYTYNNLKRLEKTTVKNSAGSTLFHTGYSYVPQEEENLSTMQVWAYSVWNPDYSAIISYRHEYDGVGNITKVMDAANSNRTLAEYTYDNLSQLTQEVLYSYDDSGTATTTTYAYTYDTAGNILTESKNGTVTKTYTYGNAAWRDLLTAVGTTEITYENGNPLTYYNGEKSYTNLTWVQGRQLASIITSGKTYSYSYDGDCIRTQKIVDGVTHTYITQNGKVVREIIGSGTTAKVLDFIYDNSGSPFALIYTNGTATPVTYYYVLDLQGDVVALMDASRNIVAQYTYNAWGEILSATGTMASINPLRYRGYYYDSETGFYYLQSRYYDPANHRFINADSLASTGQGFVGTNMFAYCGNNPVVRTDATGTFWEIIAACVIVAALLTGCGTKEEERPAYPSADAAAAAFATEVYASSKYSRHEYSTEIYTTTKNGVTSYHYTEPVVGQPHIATGINLSRVDNIVAYAHTHPTSNTFSPDDKQVGKNKLTYAYVIGPNLWLQRYDYANGMVNDQLALITPVELTEQERLKLSVTLESSWRNHFSLDGYCYVCGAHEDDPWP